MKANTNFDILRNVNIIPYIYDIYIHEVYFNDLFVGVANGQDCFAIYKYHKNKSFEFKSR